MPLIETHHQPTFERLRQEGFSILSVDRAQHQDIRELHIGLLNMMPDTALLPTERQFSRLIGSSNLIAQFHLHMFSFPEVPRTGSAKQHVDQFYHSVDEIKAMGLDGLIISGANPLQSELSLEPFWAPLCDIFDWAAESVTSVICSCLATHAYMHYKHGEARHALDKKCWGVYDHHVIEQNHPLTKAINHRFPVAHSRYNVMHKNQFEQHGFKVLVESEAAGVHIATSPDGFRFILQQGHPEYDTHSLLKEYKREYLRVKDGTQTRFPALVENYFSPQATAILEECKDALLESEMPDFPETLLAERIENTWRDTSKAMINNWLGQVYQLTGYDRSQPFMPGIDPLNPFSHHKK